MNHWINYHHLNYFRVIASEGSISKAAEKLRLGQPTLSAQLKQFEEQLGVRLFDRQHKKLILTEQGKIALNYAQTIFKLGFEMVCSNFPSLIDQKKDDFQLPRFLVRDWAVSEFKNKINGFLYYV